MSKVYSIKPHRLPDHFDAEASAKLRDLAKRFDAAILVDGDGDVALLARIYNDEGVQQVRHSPDPCNFHPVEWWTSVTTTQAEKAVC